MNLPDEFLLWLFENGCAYRPRYEKHDRQAEYGISEAEFMDSYQGEAIEDGRNIWEKLSSEDKILKVSQWKRDLQIMIDRNSNLLLTEIK